MAEPILRTEGLTKRFGGLVALCTGIPLVNFFVVPAAVVGATLLWCEELTQ